MPQKLSPDEIARAVTDLQGWKSAPNSLQREFTFASFAAAMTFVNNVASVAEKMDHHPDIDIRYSRVKLTLSSHDAGGVTERDLKLAAAISAAHSQADAK